MSTSWSLFSGFSKLSRVPAGNAAKAASFGAKTVKLPGELNVSASSPATTAATRVDKLSTDCANSTMFFVGSSCTSNLEGSNAHATRAPVLS